MENNGIKVRPWVVMCKLNLLWAQLIYASSVGRQFALLDSRHKINLHHCPMYQTIPFDLVIDELREMFVSSRMLIYELPGWENLKARLPLSSRSIAFCEASTHANFILQLQLK